MTKNKCYQKPMHFLHEFTAQYPDCWRIVDTWHAKNISNLSPKTYIPTVACGEICRQSYGLEVTQAIVINAYDSDEIATHMATLAAWRQYKIVYDFSGPLRRALLAQADDIKSQVIPTPIFESLPTYCVYIHAPTSADFASYDGFFVWLEDLGATGQYLRMLLCVVPERPSSWISFTLPLEPGMTVASSVQKAFEDDIATHNYDSYIKDVNVYTHIKKFIRDAICQMLQFVLYICSDNADITVDKQQASIYRPGDTIKDKVREIQLLNVGESLDLSQPPMTPADEVLRREQHLQGTSSPHSSPRAHLRRGHYHHYWVGPRNDPDVQRKLVLRWYPPTIVNSQKQ